MEFHKSSFFISARADESCSFFYFLSDKKLICEYKQSFVNDKYLSKKRVPVEIR